METIKEKKRILSTSEKNELLTQFSNCYLCNNSLTGYNKDEIQFDHIYNYADGYSQDISNFAPVHASPDDRKLNCHKNKGQKSPISYKEELRIQKKLCDIKGLKDLCNNPIQSIYCISTDHKKINFNGIEYPLFNQVINNKNNYYFCAEVDIKYIENDDIIQLRPLEAKILPLIFNLKTSVQLLPSLGRLDEISNTVKIFDGQHKAVAQIIGNNRTYIECKIFVHPNEADLQTVIYQAHTDLVQQKYQKSHMDTKLASIYQQRIESLRLKLSDNNAPYSEFEILKSDKKSQRKNIIVAAIKDEVKNKSNYIQEYVAQNKQQKNRPILYQSLDKLINIFCNTEPVKETSDSKKNFREAEVENFMFILSEIVEHSLRNKWDINNNSSINHIVSRTYYYKTAFDQWIKVLEEALRHVFDITYNCKTEGALCYRENFEPGIKDRFSKIIKKLFDHPLWLKPNYHIEIAQANNSSPIIDIFQKEGLFYGYLVKN